MYLSNLTLMMLYALMIGSISPTGELAAVMSPIFFLLSLVGISLSLSHFSLFIHFLSSHSLSLSLFFLFLTIKLVVSLS
jgi:hypothetical protein